MPLRAERLGAEIAFNQALKNAIVISGPCGNPGLRPWAPGSVTAADRLGIVSTQTHQAAPLSRIAWSTWPCNEHVIHWICKGSRVYIVSLDLLGHCLLTVKSLLGCVGNLHVVSIARPGPDGNMQEGPAAGLTCAQRGVSFSASCAAGFTPINPGTPCPL